MGRLDRLMCSVECPPNFGKPSPHPLFIETRTTDIHCNFPGATLGIGLGRRKYTIRFADDYLQVHCALESCRQSSHIAHPT